jgi:hypothetical protein
MAGRKLIEEKFTYSVFREKLNGLFDWLQIELCQKHNSDSSKISH